MSWTNKGGGGQGPWGQKPSGPVRPDGGPGGNRPGGSGGRGPGNPPPPDFDQFLKRGQDGFRQIFSGGGRSAVLVVAGIIVLWFASGLFRVDANEQGVVLRFGQYNRTVPSGLHYHLPYPMEVVYKPDVTGVNSVEIGDTTPVAGSRFRSDSDSEHESQMLTGDMNIVEINFEVQWKIKAMEAEKFLFNVRNAEGVVKPIAESAMREVIGQLKLQDILTTSQGEIARRTQDIMQHTLDSYDAGIEIVNVNMPRPDVPGEVIEAFQDVKKAEQDRQTTISIAERYRNEIMPKARGEAVRMAQDALAYKMQTVADAQGNVSRFLAVYEQYKAAPEVTKKRIYLETMQDVFSGMPKMILDTHGVTPYLPLPGMGRPAAETPAMTGGR